MTLSLKLYILTRVELQLGSLNASGAIGNYTKLQEGYVVVNNELIPVPVITGSALKNWHARAMAEKYVELGGNKIHSIHYKDMYRLPKDVANRDVQSYGQKKNDRRDSEKTIINMCAICDLHGLLIAEQNTPEYLQIKRESLVKFSFAVPVEELVAKTLKYPVVHNRVAPEAMMTFKREYASALWGWQASIDIASIGRSQLERDESNEGKSVWLGTKLVDDQEIARRAKSAILAFEKVLSGALGASTSRALPIFRPIELVAILVQGCTPVPLHPYYTNYKDYLAKYVVLYFNKIEKVYSMNVKLKNQVETGLCKAKSTPSRNGEPSQKCELSQQIRNEIDNKIEEYEDYYKLIESLASFIEEKYRTHIKS